MKILMVCLGNICRSPLAEGILQDKIKQHKLPWSVDSAGTSGWHSGEAPDRRSVETAKLHGIDISAQRSRKLSPYDLEVFDIIFAMDSQNYQDICRLAKNETEKQKVKLILNESNPNRNQSVPDPYYGGVDGFENIYQMLDIACDAIIENYN